MLPRPPTHLAGSHGRAPTRPACGVLFTTVRVLIPLLLSFAACGKADVKAVEDERLPPNNACLDLEDDDAFALRTSCHAFNPAAPADTLFVVDDGPGSLPLQRQLADAMPAFVDRILQSRLSYDLRIAFESSDVESSLRRPKPCEAHREDFSDFAACEAGCNGDALASDNGRWVEIHAGQSIDRDQLVETLRCGAMLGDAGPKVAEPLRSAANLWSSGEPFIRPGYRSMVIVTGGPECSRNRPQAIAGREVDDPDEARERCYASGTLCDELGCRVANLDHLGRETTEDDALLLPLVAFTDTIEALALQSFLYPETIQVSAIAPPAFDDLQPVCDLDGTPLYPAVRLSALAGESKLDLLSACEPDWSPYLVPVAEQLADSMPMCMPACVADVDEDTPGLQVECDVVSERFNERGRLERAELPRCDEEPGSAGCWRAVTQADLHPICAEEGWNLELVLEFPEPPPFNLAVFPRCELSQTKTEDCPDLR